ncbi:MAG: 2-oxoacid:acceptor oxidoreductase family protein [Desulfobacterales bacterium]|jgi:indolepyruvate ferredoxin oxidoreductase beta subunit|nr:2-oxoacid:acceptor oxidoreductase family protein [Desulfobacterales bacterium]
MHKTIKQQILISGVGGQGVLFITGLLAEAAINKGLPVFTSETHGMAQRGGTVVSHLKVGNFSSPLIRPFKADGLLVLKDENMAQHGSFLKTGGWAVINSENDLKVEKKIAASAIDADQLAQKISNPKSANLIVLGFALGRAGDRRNLFCSLTDIKKVLRKKFGRHKKMLDASLLALQTGYKASRKKAAQMVV